MLVRVSRGEGSAGRDAPVKLQSSPRIITGVDRVRKDVEGGGGDTYLSCRSTIIAIGREEHAW